MTSYFAKFWTSCIVDFAFNDSKTFFYEAKTFFKNKIFSENDSKKVFNLLQTFCRSLYKKNEFQTILLNPYRKVSFSHAKIIWVCAKQKLYQ